MTAELTMLEEVDVLAVGLILEALERLAEKGVVRSRGFEEFGQVLGILMHVIAPLDFELPEVGADC
ncbi:hypothetical protein [Nocardioides sp. W7]|uniref:hypothetical protein n=1 Tax=Nocardioides sp. W7 TaxID=2931390 RepID=UPI001FD4190D|nr:hypothetical protein [Nocardioides sp. W7]